MFTVVHFQLGDRLKVNRQRLFKENTTKVVSTCKTVFKVHDFWGLIVCAKLSSLNSLKSFMLYLHLKQTLLHCISHARHYLLSSVSNYTMGMIYTPRTLCDSELMDDGLILCGSELNILMNSSDSCMKMDLVINKMVISYQTIILYRS